MWLSRKFLKAPMNYFSFIVLNEQSVNAAGVIGPNANANLAWLGCSQAQAGAHGNGCLAAANGIYPQLGMATQAWGTYLNREIIFDMIQRQRPGVDDQIYIKGVKITMHNCLASDRQPMFCMTLPPGENEQIMIDAQAGVHRAIDPAKYKIVESASKLKTYVRATKRPTGVPVPNFIACPVIGGGLTAVQITKWNMPDIYCGSMVMCRLKIKVYYRVKKIRL